MPERPLLDGQSVSATPHLDRLRSWADERGLKVKTYAATQREPDHVVALSDGGEGWTKALLSRTSTDSAEVAAMYLINVLDRLGAL